MSKNHTQQRRGIPTSTAAAAATQERLLQGAAKQTPSSQLSSNVGRAAAKKTSNRKDPNANYISKSDVTSSKTLIPRKQSIQLSAIGEIQNQALGTDASSYLMPSGTDKDPSGSKSSRTPLLANSRSIRIAPVSVTSVDSAPTGTTSNKADAANSNIQELDGKLIPRRNTSNRFQNDPNIIIGKITRDEV